MAIEVTQEADRGRCWPLEKCAFCKQPTRFWFQPKDVAVCETCAAGAAVDDVPSKRDWLVSNGAKLPEGWLCDADRRAVEAC